MKCYVCGADGPIFACVLWCDACIDEIHETGESIKDFMKRKKQGVSQS